MLAVISHYKCLCHIICPLPMHAIVNVSQQTRPLLLLVPVISILVMLAIMMQSLSWLLSGCSGADRWSRPEGSFSSLNPIVACSSSPKTLPRHGCPVSPCASMIFKPALGSFQASSKGGYCANTILRVINGYRMAHRRSKSPQGSITQHLTIWHYHNERLLLRFLTFCNAEYCNNIYFKFITLFQPQILFSQLTLSVSVVSNKIKVIFATKRDSQAYPRCHYNLP